MHRAREKSLSGAIHHAQNSHLFNGTTRLATISLAIRLQLHSVVQHLPCQATHAAVGLQESRIIVKSSTTSVRMSTVMRMMMAWVCKRVLQKRFIHGRSFAQLQKNTLRALWFDELH